MRRRLRPAGDRWRPSSTGSGRTCCSTSSTTSSPARRSSGSTRTPRPPTTGSRPSWRSSSPRRSGRLAPGTPPVASARRDRERGRGRRGAPVGGGPSQPLPTVDGVQRRGPGVRRRHRRGADRRQRDCHASARSPTAPRGGVGRRRPFTSILALGPGREVLLPGGRVRAPAAPRPSHRVRRLGPRGVDRRLGARARWRRRPWGRRPRSAGGDGAGPDARAVDAP